MSILLVPQEKESVRFAPTFASSGFIQGDIFLGQVPSKYFLPSAPYGSSEAANALTPSVPAAFNPQTPLLPPNFTDPGTMQQQTSSPLQAAASANPYRQNPFQNNPYTRGM